MRGTSIGLIVGAVLMAAAGAGFFALGAAIPLVRTGMWIGGVAFVVAAVVMLAAARWVGTIGGSRLRAKGGVPGTARVLAVHDTGVTINELTAIFRIEAEISVPGRVPYTGSFRLPVGRTQWGAIQAGMTLPVLVDPADAATIAYDDAPREPVLATLAATAQAAPAGSVQTRSARDIVVRGTHAAGVVLGAQLTGRTAGELTTTPLAADEADDPVAIVQLRVEPTGGAPFAATTALRVPDGKQGLLAPGTRVAVAYLPEDPAGTTTIDWERS